MTSFFNFRAECLYKYDQEIYEKFMESFDLFPLAAIINGKFLAVHGGISPDLKSVTHSLHDPIWNCFFWLRLDVPGDEHFSGAPSFGFIETEPSRDSCC